MFNLTLYQSKNCIFMYILVYILMNIIFFFSNAVVNIGPESLERPSIARVVGVLWLTVNGTYLLRQAYS